MLCAAGVHNSDVTNNHCAMYHSKFDSALEYTLLSSFRAVDFGLAMLLIAFTQGHCIQTLYTPCTSILSRPPTDS